MFDIQTPFFLAAIAASLIVILTWVTLEETLTPEQRTANRRKGGGQLRPRAVIGNYPLIMILFIVFVAQFGFGLLQSTFALFGEDVLFAGQSEDAASLGIGLLLAVIGLGQLVTQVFFLPPLVRRYGDAPLVIGGAALRGLSMFIYAVITSPWLAGIGGWIFAVGAGVMSPTSQSIATQTVDDELRGGVLGIYQSSRNLAIIFGTGLAGTLYAIEPTIPYWIGGVLFMISLIPGFMLLRWFGEQSPPVSESAGNRREGLAAK
jgi:MFS family permease